MLTDKDKLLHAVAILFIPVTSQAWVTDHEILQLCLRHRGIPLSCIADVHLFTRLLKDITGISLVSEIADSLGTDDTLRPFTGYELVE